MFLRASRVARSASLRCWTRSSISPFGTDDTDDSSHSSGIDYDEHQFPMPLMVPKIGNDLIHDPIYNKGTGYGIAERDRLGIRGLVPPRRFEIEEQCQRILRRFHSKRTNLEKHSYLLSLHDRNETLFYRVLMDNIEEMAPIIYTPTVGEACQNFGIEFRRARGMYFSALDKGHMAAMTYNWPAEEVDVVVVTDGSRILGLGDLGVNGMGISIGKLSLYVAAGGIHPRRVLPVMLDVGTDNEELRKAPLYLGLQQPRLRGKEYFAIVDEFMTAVRNRYPDVLIQFEDFQNEVALPILQKYRNNYLCFNDDIQGTGTVTLAGLFSALRAQRLPFHALTDQRVVCLGAGSAGLGVCESIITAMVNEGMTEEEARERFYVVDKDGLLGSERDEMSTDQRPFARKDLSDGMSLIDVVRESKATILLGLSGAAGTFTEEVVKQMASQNSHPIIFPLSNPTSKAECSFEQCMKWTNGKALFASGSPFDQIEIDGRTFIPSQGNNMLIFPGVGLAAVVFKLEKITDSMFYRAARTLAEYVPEHQLSRGMIYPQIPDIRNVSMKIATAVAREAYDLGLAKRPRPQSLAFAVKEAMYSPEYSPLIYNYR